MKSCDFLVPKVAIFVMGSKDVPQKMQSLSSIKKVASQGTFIPNAKWRETPTDVAVTKPK